MLKRYFLECSYLGQNYVGWQKQPDQKSVQTTIDEALSTVLQENLEVMGAGRTDTGVHAKYFIAHFDTETALEHTENLIYKLNTVLPADIAVQNIYRVNANHHARFDAVSRSYQYRIATQKNPFEITSAYYIKNALDVKLMHKCAQRLLDFSNFKSFCKVKTAVNTFECDVIEAEVKNLKDDLVVFNISANRFLRNMVRAITGTLIDVGLGKTHYEDFINIIKSQDRRKAGKSVPAHGLYLTDIKYPYPLKSIYEQD
ncbi:MAG: tRNA pseudouridine(38-40) synthase TruA [Bacteroidetes bacterium]|jgi:tRNA pseudouridine38-40 synthase|nr:tRNA pseudouridine(38-40) synthase TruA [Bacteroidota bacterium]